MAQAKAAPPTAPIEVVQPEQPIGATQTFQAGTQTFQAAQATQSFRPVEVTQSIQPAQATQPFQAVPDFQPVQPLPQTPVPALTPVLAPVQVQTPVAPAKVKSGKSPVLLIVVVFLVLLILGGAGAGYWFFLRPAPAAPTGVLQLNATPYAEVVSVTDDKGKAVALPAGDHWTPMRLDAIPPGHYVVTLKGPDGSPQNQQCDVTDSPQVCAIELKPIDDNTLEQIVGGTR